MRVEIPTQCLPWLYLHRTHVAVETYNRDLEADFGDLIDAFGNVKSVIDIGCGLCGIDVLLNQRYGCELILVDGDGPVEDFRGGFQETMRPFNSREAANALLERNGVTNYQWVDIGTKEVLKADAAFSLFSMGHHYPADTYNIDADVIVLDIRAGTDGIQRMKRPHKVLRSGPKGDRVAFFR